MPKIHTHYDELKVARDASPEEIKRAYRKLAQQLHPDRNPSADASDLMAVLNASHDVLRNPAKRIVYDDELNREAQRAQGAALRRAQAQAGRQPAAKPRPSPQTHAKVKPRSAAKPAAAKPSRRGSVVRWAAVFMVFCAAGAWMGYDRQAGKPFVPPPVVEEVAAQMTSEVAAADVSVPAGSPIKVTEPDNPGCAAPLVDPMGAPWPAKAGYIAGMPRVRDGGWSEITIDNSAGEVAVYAKVTDASGRYAYRHAFVPPHSLFTFTRMDVGYYLLKYKMLDTGCAYSSSRIRLEETSVGDRIKSSVYKLTLRQLDNRNSQFSNVRRDEF
jgi:hypothetical protein